MRKFWNFLFYMTWVTLRDAVIYGINKPITQLGLWFYPNRKTIARKKVLSYNKRYIQSEMKPENSSMVHHAFQFMLFSTSVILGLLVMSFAELFDIATHKNGVYGLMGVILFSILFNYLLLYENDKYLVYFKNFQKENISKIYYLVALLLHVLPFLLLMKVSLD